MLERRVGSENVPVLIKKQTIKVLVLLVPLCGKRSEWSTCVFVIIRGKENGNEDIAAPDGRVKMCTVLYELYTFSNK